MARTAKKKQQVPSNRPALVRKNRMSIMFNDEELKMLNRFVAKYKITNKSKWVREVVMTAVFKQLSDDYPSLFE